jgi:hypothetical protein
MIYIDAIKVSNQPNIEIMNKNKNASLYISKFLERYPDNNYAKYLKDMNYKEFCTNVGFDNNDYINLKKWVNNKSISEKIVVFDWDGTLSIIEGIILPKNKAETKIFKKLDITNKDIALYYAGTKERLQMINEMALYLYTHNIPIFILTNNPIASNHWKKVTEFVIGSESRNNFYNIVKQFIPQIKKSQILCGYETNCFKPETFSNNNYLQNIYNKIEHWHYNNT